MDLWLCTCICKRCSLIGRIFSQAQMSRREWFLVESSQCSFASSISSPGVIFFSLFLLSQFAHRVLFSFFSLNLDNGCYFLFFFCSLNLLTGCYFLFALSICSPGVRGVFAIICPISTSDILVHLARQPSHFQRNFRKTVFYHLLKSSLKSMPMLVKPRSQYYWAIASGNCFVSLVQMLLVSENLQEVVCNDLILLLMFCMSSRGGLISCFWFCFTRGFWFCITRGFWFCITRGGLW